MRNSKKFLVLLLGMLIACAFALVACQPAVEPVQLVDFDDTTVTAELGKNYTLPSGTAFDTKDNVYRATYTVKTKSGGNVNVSSNQFFVADMNGYVITGVTDTLPDGTTKTRTITINVEDKGAPEIKMGTAGFGYVNSEYVIPEITVTDLSGESITPVVKVYKVVGDTETEVTVTDGKFTPTEKVTYRIKVSATDSSNNTATQSADVIVRGEKAPYVLEDFSDDHSLSIMTCPENGHSDVDDVWLEEFEGRSGVAYNPKTLSMYGPHFYFRLPEEIKNVDFEYVYARVYVKSEIGELKPTFDACSWNHVIGTY
ncbi:MAG: hypothetical protein IKD03_03855, partial [Clostridia bacterium]|nr:hypothetical protein [Clostridia bacterium]